VRKGEKGTTVVYADRFISDAERRQAEQDGDEPVLRDDKRAIVRAASQDSKAAGYLLGFPARG
jgi:antirestriction protein ArdC